MMRFTDPAVWRRSGGLVLAVVTLASSGAVEARTGLLPVRGPTKLADELGASVLATLGTPERQVLGPAELRQRLVAAPRVATALKAAGRAIAQAEEAALYMKKKPSSSAARKAVAQLVTIAGRHHTHTIVGRAHLARGIAALLEPMNRAKALVAFHAAFAVDPDLKPDPDRVPTRTAKLLERARRDAPSATPPTREELAVLVQLSGLEELLWVAVEPQSGQIEVIALYYNHQAKTLTGPHRLSRPLPGPDGWGKVSADVVALLGLSAPAPALAATPPEFSAEVDLTSVAPRGSTARPWYRRWWVWALAGSVVAGSTVAIVAGTSRTERSYGFRFELK